MKLLIDIPGEEYKMRVLWAKSDNLCSPDTIWIARGLPYEERTQGGLISREALKEVIAEKATFIDGDSVYKIIALINNAPTVKFSLMPADETKEDAYKRGYEKGKVEGILKANARPQGDLANEVWKLYEKHRSHLATHVIEFGDELKELLGKYQEGGADND